VSGLLPAPFADLERHAPTWCLASEAERWERRMTSSMPELLAFYGDAFPRLEEAIEHCDRYPLDDLPADVERLLQLVHSLVLVAMAVEIFGQPKTVDAADAVLHRVREPRP
jgi:predicted GTPase